MPLRYSDRTAEAYLPPLLIRHLLANSVDQAGANQIVQADGPRFSYVQFIERVSRLADSLSRRGVGKGTTVAVMDWDSHRYLECFFAIPMLGAVLMTVNVRLSRDQVAYTLADSEATVVLVHRDFAELFEEIRPQLGRVALTIGLSDSADPQWFESCDCDYESLIAGGAADHTFEDFDENALATTFYTTGTTGRPKAVAFSHRQIVLHTLGAAAALGAQPDSIALRRSDVYLPLTPMFHVHAWGLPFVATMLGMKQIYPGRFDAASVVALRVREKATFSHCVPTILQMLMDAVPPGDEALEGWKLLIGGSALTPALREAARLRGMKTSTGYGMSESCPIITVSRAGQDGNDEAALSHAGYPMPLTYVDIGLTTGGQGEVLVRSPWLTQSYLRQPEASGALWDGGWLHTSDVGYRHNGDLVIADRLKDVIKSGGEWVSSVEIEQMLVTHPGIAEVAVVGVADQKWGERPVAAIVPASDDAVTLAMVHAHLLPSVEAGILSRFALPDRIELFDRLPRTSVGKIDKKAIRERVNLHSEHARQE